MTSLLKGLSEETVVLLGAAKQQQLPFPLTGIVRLVDARGRTLAVVLDKDTLEAIEEEGESSSPAFLAALDVSRRSGRVSGDEVKKRLGLRGSVMISPARPSACWRSCPGTRPNGFSAKSNITSPRTTR